MLNNRFFFIILSSLFFILLGCGVEGDPIPPESDELPIVQRYVRDLTPAEVLKYTEEKALKAAEENEKKKKSTN